MASVTRKRKLESHSFQNSSDRTPKRRRSPVKMCPSPNILKSSVQRSSPPRKKALKLPSEQIVDNTRGENKKRHRKPQLSSDGNDNSDNSSSTAASSNSETDLLDPNCKDQPLFTFSQVILICENVTKERENQIRHEYDRMLNTKLADQYDAFVKFTYDQIRKRYESRAPSYVS